MNFLKKHYEKLILIVLFLVFICLLFYLLTVIRSTREVTTKDLQLPTRAPDYEQAKAEDIQFHLEKNFIGAGWEVSKSIGGTLTPVFTDLILPMEIARCPHCQYLIPLYYFNNDPHICPRSSCGGKLPTPPKKAASNLKTSANDWDGDGIPNDVEERQDGLDPRNPDDALEDMDEDGFSNLYEYLQKTDMNNPKDHPPYYHRLYISARRPVELTVILKKVIAVGKEKAQWDIQFNRKVREGSGKTSEKTEYCSLGGVIKIDGREYTVTDIKYVTRDVTNGAITVKKDESEVMLRCNADGVVLKMKVDTVALSPRSKMVLTDVGTGQEYVVDVGETFRMGARKTGGARRYQVESVDVDKMTLKLRDISNARTRKLVLVEISRSCRIPVAQRAKIEARSESAPDTADKKAVK